MTSFDDPSYLHETQSTSYKWTKEPCDSENHPSVFIDGDLTGDADLSLRRELDTPSLDRLNKLAKILDNLSTPLKPRTNNFERTRQSFGHPRATSSPKRCNQSSNRTDPTRTSTLLKDQNSRSAVCDESQTIQRKSQNALDFSMQQSRFVGSSTSSSPQNDMSRLDSPAIKSAGSTYTQATSVHSTNFKRAQVTDGEDSYIKEFQRQESPALVAAVSRVASSDTLRIRAQDLRFSPSLEKSPYNKIVPPAVRPSTGSFDIRNNPGILGRRTVSDSMTEADWSGDRISVVAVHKALSDSLQTGMMHSHDEPLANSVVENDRHTLSDRGCIQEVTKYLADDCHGLPNVQFQRSSSLPRETEISDLKESAQPRSPWVEQADVSTLSLGDSMTARNAKVIKRESEDRNLAHSLNCRSRIPNSPSRNAEINSQHGDQLLQMASMLTQLTDECVRRGQVIDKFRDHPALGSTETQIDQDLRRKLAKSEAGAYDMQRKLDRYQQDMDEMKAKMQGLSANQSRSGERELRETEGQIRSITRTKDCSRHTAADIARRCLGAEEKLLSEDQSRYANSTAPVALAGHSPDRGCAETIASKMRRWEEGNQTEHLSGQLGAQHVQQAREIPRVLSPSLRPTPSKLDFKNGIDATIQTSTAGPSGMSDSTFVHQTSFSKDPQPGVDMTCFHAATKDDMPSRQYLLSVIKKAEKEIASLKFQISSTVPSKILRVNAITPSIIQNSRDTNIPDFDKLYNRLKLGQIDDMCPNESGNLLKNICIQLNIPFADLTSTIMMLGEKHLQEEQCNNNQLVLEETAKLRLFAEEIHSTLYQGDHIEGSSANKKCLSEMVQRVEKLARTSIRNK